jgi:magnesium transporter
LRALREYRQTLRGFTLYLPPSIIPELHAAIQPNSSVPDVIPNVISTTSLAGLVTQLEALIRISGKQRRQRHRHRANKLLEGPSSSPSQLRSLSLDYPLSGSNFTTMRGRKGKRQEIVVKPARIPEEPHRKRQAWFLDVSSPTWADLQAIGKVSLY